MTDEAGLETIVKSKAVRAEPGPPRWGEPETITAVIRPKRWERPFDDGMTSDQIAMIGRRPEFLQTDFSRFPPSVPLDGIIANDMRLVTCEPGQLVLREGDYGLSAFLVLSGQLRVVVTPGLSSDALGRGRRRRRSWRRLLAGLLPSGRVPEARELRRAHGLRAGAGHLDDPTVRKIDVSETINQHHTSILQEGDLFGELAALTRLPRRASVFAETETVLLEIRWQGLRELRRHDPGWGERIDRLYRNNALKAQLRASRLFAETPETLLKKIAEDASFESYGSFDWHHSHRRARQQGVPADETMICEEGGYPDGLLLIGTGFVRVSIRRGSARRTLTYLSAGDVFGFDELYRRWQGGNDAADSGDDDSLLETSLSAVGYVDIIRLPAPVLEAHLFPLLELDEPPLISLADQPLLQDSLLQWAGEEHLINGTQTMLIDLERCVRCDECVRACAATHDGNPRFLRSGPVHDHSMVAHACMHCVDPVCMIDCPTGAIHRERSSGVVVINPESCIGCGTCANACPYSNIRMVELCEDDGSSIVDDVTRAPIRRATKCDLCIDNFGGPACVRACPQDALTRVDFIHGQRSGASA